MKRISVLLGILGALLLGDLAYAQCPPGRSGVPILSPLYIRKRMNETGSLFAAANEAQMVGQMRRNGNCYPGYEFEARNQPRGRYHPGLYRDGYYGGSGYRGQSLYGGSYYGRRGGYDNYRGGYGYRRGDDFGRIISGVGRGVNFGLDVYGTIQGIRTEQQGMRMEYDLAQRQQEIDYDLELRRLELEREAYSRSSAPLPQQAPQRYYSPEAQYQQGFQTEQEEVQFLVFTNDTRPERHVELVYKTEMDQFVFKFGPGETRELTLPKGDYPFYAFAIEGSRSITCKLVQKRDGTISIQLGGR